MTHDSKFHTHRPPDAPRIAGQPYPDNAAEAIPAVASSDPATAQTSGPGLIPRDSWPTGTRPRLSDGTSPEQPPQPEHDPLAIAHELVAAGLSVIPWQHAAKEPAHDRLPSVWSEEEGRAKRSWREFRHHLPSAEQLRRWFSDGRCGIAVVCGAVSQGLVVLDFEAPEAWKQWQVHACSLLDPAVVDDLPLARGQVDRAKLTNVQANAQSLPPLLVDYLRWLAARPDYLLHNRDRHTRQRAQLLTALEAVSDQATNPGRVASNVAALNVAWQTFGQFLQARGYWREERVLTWLGGCAQHLHTLAAAQVTLVTDERYSVQFFQAVRGLLSTGRAQLQNLDQSNGEIVKPPALIGGYDHAGTYLLPAAYDEVRKYRYQMGMPLAFGQKALLQMLEQENLFVTTDDKARKPQKAITRYLDGKRHRCWHLPPGIVFETDDRS